MATRRGSKAYAMNRSGFVLDPSWTRSAMHQPTVKLLTACPTNRPGRNRTCNPRFWRPVLYQLSYGPRNGSGLKLANPRQRGQAPRPAPLVQPREPNHDVEQDDDQEG